MFARYNVDNAYIDNPTDALGSRNVIPHPYERGRADPAHLLSANRQRDEIRSESRQLPRLDLMGHPLTSARPFDGRERDSLDTEVGTTFFLYRNSPWCVPPYLKAASISAASVSTIPGNTITTSSISYDTATFIHNAAASATYLQARESPATAALLPGLRAG